MKQKKEYMRPTMMVDELKQTEILMASGKGLASPSDYADGGDPFAEPSGE